MYIESSSSERVIKLKKMRLIDLLVVASIPVIKVLLITAVGLFLAFDSVNILGADARKHVNKVVFYVFNPALVSTNLARTVTFESFLKLWFMPVNVLITNLIGSAFGWVLVKVTRAPNQLKGLIIGSCSAGNIGNILMIIIPAICKEKASPFGEADICYEYGMAYSSLSLALGAVFLWTYVYNIVRISASKIAEKAVTDCSAIGEELNAEIAVSYTEPLLPSIEQSLKQISITSRIRGWLNLKALLAPSTIGTIVGFATGMIAPIRKLLIGNDASFHVLQDSAYLLGEAAIPTTTLILGANLLRGLKGSGIKLRIVLGIIAIRYILLPLLGIVIVKTAIHVGLLQHDPLFHFVLLLQYAVPPAMNLGTITQLFGTGQSECSVIMLWTYALIPIALTLWSTYFLWLVAS